MATKQLHHHSNAIAVAPENLPKELAKRVPESQRNWRMRSTIAAAEHFDTASRLLEKVDLQNIKDDASLDLCSKGLAHYVLGYWDSCGFAFIDSVIQRHIAAITTKLDEQLRGAHMNAHTDTAHTDTAHGCTHWHSI